ncbi:MAG: RluA family pseudouridine synthase [Clostridia bacterium]|nr:RluA family pseudouridine synthase [Clostridia bacterium]
MILKYTVVTTDDFYSVKNVLRNHFHVSTRLLNKLNKLGMIFLNEAKCNINSPIQAGDIVSFSLNYDEDNSNIIPTKMDLDIVFEDNSLIVINKPPFMAIHPTSYHFDDTLSNGVRYYYDKIGLKKKIRPVNRLDRNTSGLVVFAKNEFIQELLIKQMKKGMFKKKYLGIVEGVLENKEDSINAPISRKENSIIERKIDDKGFPSMTHYKVLQEFSNYSLVEFCLETGRTHQIRVHTQFIGHPLLGDSLYGKESVLINRQALHSYYICFNHPLSGVLLKLKSKLPKDMQKLVSSSID